MTLILQRVPCRRPVHVPCGQCLGMHLFFAAAPHAIEFMCFESIKISYCAAQWLFCKPQFSAHAHADAVTPDPDWKNGVITLSLQV